MRYFVTVHGAVFNTVDDMEIAYSLALRYRQLGLQAEVTNVEPV